MDIDPDSLFYLIWAFIGFAGAIVIYILTMDRDHLFEFDDEAIDQSGPEYNMSHNGPMALSEHHVRVVSITLTHEA